MTTKKKLFAIFALVIVAFGLIYLIDRLEMKKAKKSIERPALENGLLVTPEQIDGKTSLIPSDRIFDYGVDVPEINDAEYLSVAESDELVADDLPGIAIEVNDVNYFYPYQMLNWHQVVNEDFDGTQLSITFDPLCYCDRVYVSSGLTPTNQVYDNNALLADADGNVYSQSRGVEVIGADVGTELERYPYTSVAWKIWKVEHPDGMVLAPRTDEPRDYTRHPFGNYDGGELVLFPMSRLSTDYGIKWILDAFENNGESVVFFRDIEKGFGVTNQSVGGTAFVGIYDFDQSRTRVYSSDVNGETLTFSIDFDSKKITDDQTGSVWNVDGLAISGDMKGTQLVEQQTEQSFWMCYYAAHDTYTVAHVEQIEVPESGQVIDQSL